MADIARFTKLDEQGRAVWLMPDGHVARVTPPSNYLDWPELWANPTVSYPWLPAYGNRRVAGRASDDKLAASVSPNVHVEYVIALSTLHRLGGHITGVSSATRVLEDEARPPFTPGADLTHRVYQLVERGLLTDARVTPAARRRSEIHLTDEGRRLVESGLFPLAYEVAAERERDEASDAKLQRAEAEKSSEDEQYDVVIYDAGHTRPAPHAPDGYTQPLDTSPAPVAPSSEVDYTVLARELLNAAAEAIAGSESTAHVKLQLQESQRQVDILRKQLKMASDAVERVTKERDEARAEALDELNARRDVERNLDAVLASARSGNGVSEQTRDAIASIMKQKPITR